MDRMNVTSYSSTREIELSSQRKNNYEQQNSQAHRYSSYHYFWNGNKKRTAYFECSK